MSFFRSITSWMPAIRANSDSPATAETSVRDEDLTPDTRPLWVRTLGGIVDRLPCDDVVRKGDLGFGDQVIVTTRNSIYSLWALGDGSFTVSGGWFDQRATSPATITVNGCTYGGSAIRQDIVAGRGLFLEFGNNVSTTRIRDVRVLRSSDPIHAGSAATLPC